MAHFYAKHGMGPHEEAGSAPPLFGQVGAIRER